MKEALTEDGGRYGPSIALTRVRPHHSDPCPATKVPLSEASQPAPRLSLPASPGPAQPPRCDWSSATPPWPHAHCSILPALHMYPPSHRIAWRLHIESRGPRKQKRLKRQKKTRRCHIARLHAQSCPRLTAELTEHRALQGPTRKYTKEDVRPLVVHRLYTLS
jgi:hypothetical protein